MGMFHFEVYHNASTFNVSNANAYRVGDRLHLVASHWIHLPGRDMRRVADWAAETFTSELADIEGYRDGLGEHGELRFLALCLYKLAGHRGLRGGDVIHVQHGFQNLWLAWDEHSWLVIPAPSGVDGEPLNAANVTAFAEEIASLRQRAAAIGQRTAAGRKFSLRGNPSR